MDLLHEMKHVKMDEKTQGVMFSSIKKSFQGFLAEKYDHPPISKIFKDFWTGDKPVVIFDDSRKYKRTCHFRDKNIRWVMSLIFGVAVFLGCVSGLIEYSKDLITYPVTYFFMGNIVPYTFVNWVYWFFPFNPTIMKFIGTRMNSKIPTGSTLPALVSDPIEQMAFIKTDYLQSVQN